MSSYWRTRRARRDKWTNRMALIGITLVVVCLAVVINAKGVSLRQSDHEYQIREENLQAQVDEESRRAQELEEYKVYVKSKEYMEKIAKERLGLVNPDEILIKPDGD